MRLSQRHAAMMKAENLSDRWSLNMGSGRAQRWLNEMLIMNDAPSIHPRMRSVYRLHAGSTFLFCGVIRLLLPPLDLMRLQLFGSCLNVNHPTCTNCCCSIELSLRMTRWSWVESLEGSVDGDKFLAVVSGRTWSRFYYLNGLRCWLHQLPKYDRWKIFKANTWIHADRWLIDPD